MLESLISIREAVYFLFPLAARTLDLEVKMSILDVLYNKESKELKKYFLNVFNHLSEPRIWVKVTNFVEYFEPEIRLLVIDRLMVKPVEVAQGILLEKFDYFTPDEKRHLLMMAEKSRFKTIRQKTEELRKTFLAKQSEKPNG